MANLKVEQTTDCFGTPVVILTKKRGDIKRWEAYEAMEKNYLFGHYLMELNVSEEVPEGLYDDGDEWGLYAPEDILGRKAEEQYEKGYQTCMDERMPESQWDDNGYRVLCCACGQPAPRHPLNGELVWKSRICPHCGARLNNGEDMKPFV